MKKDSQKKFFQTKGFRVALVLLVVYVILLILPSYLFFQGRFLNSEALYKRFSISRNDFPLSYYKVAEVLTWCTVCITSLLIIFINTLYYGWSFKDELMENHYGVRKWYFNFITILYVIWGFGTVGYLFIFFEDFISFKELLNSTTQYSAFRVSRGNNITIDRQFSSDISNTFETFVHHVEVFTIGTIILFILIDLFSYLVKCQQVKHTSSTSDLTKPILKLRPLRSFVFNQLFLVDVPVVVGISLISFFVSRIPTDESIVFDSKPVFIAGGIGMHLIISQLIFLILNFVYKYKEFKIENA